MIALYAKNRPWNGQPRADFVRVHSARPGQISGYRIVGERLAAVPTPAGFLEQFGGWYHPATAWEREQFRRLGGILER